MKASSARGSNPATRSAAGLCVRGERDVVVFDWDGTVVDSIHAITSAIREAARDLGLIVPSEERARHVIGLGLQDALRHAVPDLPPARVAEFTGRYRYHFLLAKPVDQPFHGIVDLLRALRGMELRLAVATGKSRAGLDRGLAQTGLGEHFVTSRCADEGHSKPHPWMLQSIAEELGVGCERLMMIGDTSHDIEMAKACGAGSIGVVYGAHTAQAVQEARPDAIAASIEEVGILLGLPSPVVLTSPGRI